MKTPRRIVHATLTCDARTGEEHDPACEKLTGDIALYVNEAIDRNGPSYADRERARIRRAQHKALVEMRTLVDGHAYRRLTESIDKATRTPRTNRSRK